VSHGAPRRHFPDRQALLDALAEAGFERLGRNCEPRSTAPARLPGAAASDGRGLRSLATRDAALLELMFAGKHGENSGALNAAAERAFAVMLELIEQGQADGAIESGEPERVAWSSSPLSRA